MLKITKDKIYLTRGDTAFIELNLLNQDGTQYIPNPEDKVYFRLKSSITAKVILLEKELRFEYSEEDTSVWVNTILEFEEDDTKDLKFTTYKYEIEVVTVQGYHFTVIEGADFVVGPELEIHKAPEPEPEPTDDTPEEGGEDGNG